VWSFVQGKNFRASHGSLELEPARLGLGHPRHADRLVVIDPLGVTERSTASNIDDNEDDQHHNV